MPQPGRVAVTLLFLSLLGAAAHAAVTPTPGSVSVLPGNTTRAIQVQVTYPVSRLSGTGSVSVTNLPGGARTIPPRLTYTYAAGQSLSLLRFQISTAATTPPGTYRVVLTDQTLLAGSGVVILTVTPPGQPPPPVQPGVLAPEILTVTPPTVPAATARLPIHVIGRNFDRDGQIAMDTRGLQVLASRIVSSSLAELTIAVRDDATPGAREIRVINPDGQETRPPGRLVVRPRSALAGAVTVSRLAVLFPQPGAALAPEDRVRARGVVAVTGAGTVIGTWLLDGIAFDRFALYATGGVPLHVESHVPIPSLIAGEHRLELAIESPQPLRSKPLTLAGVVESRTALRLLVPRDGASLAAAPPPAFRWTLVPGATGYEIEMQEPTSLTGEKEPRRFRTAVAEWSPDAATWSQIGAGEWVWRVRPVLLGELKGDPSEKRRFVALPPSVDVDGVTPSADDATGRPAVTWAGGSPGVLYRLELYEHGSLVPSFTALTRDSTYPFPRWARYGPGRAGVRVTALGVGDGILGSSGIIETPVAENGPVWGVRPAAEGEAPTVVAIAPPDGGAVASTQPTIEAQWEGQAPEEERSLAIDEVDVTQLADWSETSVSYTSQIELPPGDHSVTLRLGQTTQAWQFTVNPEGPAEEAVVSEEAVPPDWGLTLQGSGVGWQLPDTDAGAAAAGSLPTLPPGNVTRLQVGVQADRVRGPYSSAITGDFSTRHDFDDPKREVEENRNWLATAGAQQGRLSGGARVGLGMPTFVDQAEILATGMPRIGVEGSMGATRVALSGYHSVEWETVSAGGAQSPDQTIRGGALTLGGDSSRALFRAGLIDIDARAGPLTTGGTGTVKGFFGRLMLGTSATLVAEGARGGFTPSVDGTPLDADGGEWVSEEDDSAEPGAPLEQKGNAWRVSLMGSYRLFSYTVNVRQSDSTFTNPANQGFTLGGTGNLFSADVALAQGWNEGKTTLALNARHASSDVAPEEGAPKLYNEGGDLTLTLGVGRPVTLALATSGALRKGDGYDTLGLPETDAVDLGSTVTLTETVKALSLSQMASYQRTDDRINDYGNSTTSSGMVSANGMLGPYVTLSAMGMATRSESDPALGKNDMLTLSAQPTIQVPRIWLMLQPGAAYSRTKNDVLETDMTTEQYGTLLTWSPVWVRSLLTLQLQADWSRQRGFGLENEGQFQRRLAGALTLRWSFGRGADVPPATANLQYLPPPMLLADGAATGSVDPGTCWPSCSTFPGARNGLSLAALSRRR